MTMSLHPACCSAKPGGDGHHPAFSPRPDHAQAAPDPTEPEPATNGYDAEAAGDRLAAAAASPQPGAATPDMHQQLLEAMAEHLQAIRELLAHQATEPEAIDLDQLAQRLAGVHRTTIERWDAAGLIGPVGRKIGGRKPFDLTEVSRWIAAGMPKRSDWLAMEQTRNRGNSKLR